MVYKFINYVLSLIFKDRQLYDEDMGYVPNAMDGIEDDEVIFGVGGK